MTRPRKLARCPSVCQGNRCTRGAGHKGDHYALEPSDGWPENNPGRAPLYERRTAPEHDRVALARAVVEQWRGEGWGSQLRDSRCARDALLLAADSAMTPDDLRELARRL